jgi:hypothetical protein
MTVDVQLSKTLNLRLRLFLISFVKPEDLSVVADGVENVVNEWQLEIASKEMTEIEELKISNRMVGENGAQIRG